jgi:hypothetical protein
MCPLSIQVKPDVLLIGPPCVELLSDLELPSGFEPEPKGWKPLVLPLNTMEAVRLQGDVHGHLPFTWNVT